jgi:hypothetical protein
MVRVMGGVLGVSAAKLMAAESAIPKQAQATVRDMLDSSLD